jgi:predicted metal-binding protein
MVFSKTLNEAAATTGVPVHEWALLSADALTFSHTLFDYCKTNVCGNYNKSWTCPPACRSIEEHQKIFLACEKLLVFTTKHNIEDSFDYDGMTKGRERHTLLTIEIKKRLGDVPAYGAGSCPVCKNNNDKVTCAFPAPCRYPHKQIGSIEAAGIDVTELSKVADVAYRGEPNTVTYFSLVLIPAPSIPNLNDVLIYHIGSI